MACGGDCSPAGAGAEYLSGDVFDEIMIVGYLVRVFLKFMCLIVLAAAYGGNTAAAGLEGRTVIRLSAEHQTLVFDEMQQFLAGVQQITGALARDDMDTVVAVARSLGTSMSQHIPAALKQALPEAFRKQGHAVHSGFDQIAMDAEALGDRDHSLSQLSDTLDGCVACHNSFQIEAK